MGLLGFLCVCVCACVRACLRVCVSACLRACVPACLRACEHSCVPAHEHSCVRVCGRVWGVFKGTRIIHFKADVSLQHICLLTTK